MEDQIRQLHAWDRLDKKGIYFRTVRIKRKLYIEPMSTVQHFTMSEAKEIWDDLQILFPQERK